MSPGATSCCPSPAPDRLMFLRRPLQAALALILFSASSVSALPKSEAARMGATYLSSRQTTDGGFFIQGAPANLVAEVVSAISAVGGHEPTVDKALRYIAEHGPSDSKRRGAYAGRLVTAVVSAGRDPRNFGGFDYLAQLKSFHNPVTGQYDTGDISSKDNGDVFDNALAALGIVAAGEPLPGSSIDYFAMNQCQDGGFGAPNGCLDRSDVDTTASVTALMAKVPGPRAQQIRTRGREFLKAAQNERGGFGYYAAETTASNSTGLAIAAIAGLGEDPRDWRKGPHDPVSALTSLQRSDGSFSHTIDVEGAKDWATVQAVQGLAKLDGTAPAAEDRRTGASDTTAGQRLETAAPTSAPQSQSAPAELAGSGPDTSGSEPSEPAIRSAAARGEPPLGWIAALVLIISLTLPIRWLRRRAGVLLILLAAVVSTQWASPSQACAKGNTATVVVRGPDGEQEGRCIDPGDEGMHGVEALRQAGFGVETKSFMGLGEAVCRIDGQGNDPGSCPSGQGHWHYWRYSEGAWREAQVGPSQSTLRRGEADGWTWSPGAENVPPVGVPVCERPASSRRPEPPLSTYLPEILGGAVVIALAISVGIRRRRT